MADETEVTKKFRYDGDILTVLEYLEKILPKFGVKFEILEGGDGYKEVRISKDPEKVGWETDSGTLGYGLTKADAEFLAAAANEKLEREILRIRLWRGDTIVREFGINPRAHFVQVFAPELYKLSCLTVELVPVDGEPKVQIGPWGGRYAPPNESKDG